MIGLNPLHVLEVAVRPALRGIGIGGVAAEQLVLGTGAVESRLMHLRQLARPDGRRGPAVGLWQMEPRTHDDLWENYLLHRWALEDAMRALLVEGEDPDAGEMGWNLRYGAAMCRVHYRRVPAPLPAPGDVEGMARYWKAYYNTPAGAGTPGKFVEAWEEMELGELWTGGVA